MRISEVVCEVLALEETDSASCDTAQDNALIELVTPSGLRGVGEVEANPWVIKSLIEAPATNAFNIGLGQLVVGLDPTRPQEAWEYLYRRSILNGRRGIGICALGAIDMAMWDLAGQIQGKPVWALISSRPTSEIGVYASLLPVGKTLAEYRESLFSKIQWACENGFKALKAEIMIRGPYAQFGLQESNLAIIDLVHECRRMIGSRTLMIDVGYCWADSSEALSVLKKIEACEPYFVETPLPPDDLKGYAEITQGTAIPIAAGELLQTRFEFEDLMDRGRVSVVQPDVGRVGGITEALRVVAAAEKRGLTVVPHCWKSGIGIAASAHLAAVTSSCPFIEFLPSDVSESPLRRELLAEELIRLDGTLALPSMPGLGVRLNRSTIDRYRVSQEGLQPARLAVSNPQ